MVETSVVKREYGVNIEKKSIKAMTKVNIVEMLYDHLDMPQKDSVHIVESFFDIIKDELDNGNAVNISGFGKWTVKSKKARKGRNPQTCDVIKMVAKKVPIFKAGQGLKAAVK